MGESNQFHNVNLKDFVVAAAIIIVVSKCGLKKMAFCFSKKIRNRVSCLEVWGWTGLGIRSFNVLYLSSITILTSLFVDRLVGQEAKMRSRSNTASSSKGRKQRAQSRASTASVHSAITQADHQIQDGHGYMNQMYDPGPQMQQQHSHQRFQSIEQMNPEDIIIYQSAQQLRNPREYGSIIDPALGGQQHHGLQYGENGVHQMQMETSYMEEDTQILDGRSEEQEEIDSAGAVPVKKPSKSSAANELEMRQLFHQNKDKSLTEIAKQLQVNERGPNSERHRQVFAMLWYACPGQLFVVLC